MKKWKSLYSNNKKIFLSEDLSFLNIWKYLDEDMMQMIEDLIKKFNAPRKEVCRELATLFDVLASEEEDKKNELEK